MHVIETRNVHQALPEVLRYLQTAGVKRDSRNGSVLKAPEPVAIVYRKPQERVMFWEERDANPFFHCLESMWMLGGRQDVAFPASIVSSMANFSDNGITYNGAYGYRWRQHFGFDQLTTIADALKKTPDCRRQVLSMWDGDHDLGLHSKDLPCNTHAYFSINDSRLDMLVCNRSNDAVWGALGANAVHFSILQEYMAARIGCGIGTYTQMSNNLHLYLNAHEQLMLDMVAKAYPSTQYICPYETGVVKPTPLIPSGNVMRFDTDNLVFLQDQQLVLGIEDRFIRTSAAPLWAAIRMYKELQAPDRYDATMEYITRHMDGDSDWSAAAWQWVAQRRHRWEAKQ